jgi:HEAT repeat protein
LYAASSIYWTVSHGSEHARVAAAEVLGRLPEPRSIPYLVEALRDPSAGIRTAAKNALVRIDRHIPDYDEHDEDVLQAVLLLLEDKNEHVRGAAVMVLMAVNRPIATLYLGEILIYGSPQAARDATLVLKALQPPRSLWAILPDMYMGSAERRNAAMEEATKYDASLAGKYLRPLLGDTDGTIRISAAAQLLKIGQDEWQPLIKGDADDFARLGDSGQEWAAVPLTRALASTDQAIRQGAMDGLLRLKHPGLAEELLRPLMLNPWEIRIPIAEVLGALADPRAIDCLAAVSADAKAGDAVRIACVRALGAIPERRASDSLKKMLDKMDGEVRRAALEVLR